MTDSSKDLYRRRLLKLCKRKHTDELSYLENIMKNNDKHVGFSLFKRRDKGFRVFLYLFTLVVVSIVLSYFLSYLFIKPRWLGFIIIFITIYNLNFFRINSAINFSVAGSPRTEESIQRS